MTSSFFSPLENSDVSVVERLLAADNCATAHGMRLDVSPAGEIDIWMPVTPPMLNGLGFCHGGMIVTLADTAMAFTLIARHEAGFVTAWLNTTFAFSAQLGDVLHTRTAIVSETKKTTLVDVTVFKQDGVDIAHVRGQLIHLAGNKS